MGVIPWLLPRIQGLVMILMHWYYNGVNLLYPGDHLTIYLPNRIYSLRAPRPNKF